MWHLKGTRLSVQIGDRDIALMRGLFESRIMNSSHICAVHFAGKKAATKKRLQKLKAAGLLGERRRRPYEPSVLFLTRKAFGILHERGILTEYPKLGPGSWDKRAQVSDLTIRHELEVMDVKTALHSALRENATFSIVEFSTWPLLFQFEAVRPGYGGVASLVQPDGFIRIHEKEPEGDGLCEHTFFLEVDRSSETLDKLVGQAGSYLDYFKSGGFAVRNGAEPSAYKEYPFRVLMVFKTAERRNNIAERLLQNTPPIFTQILLATMKDAKCDPLGPIWIRPKEYRAATSGTAFDASRKRESFGYKRHSPREIFIEKHVKKCRMLVDEDTGSAPNAALSR